MLMTLQQFLSIQKFTPYLTKMSKLGLLSHEGFKYLHCLSRLKTYKEWTCSKKKKTGCLARFCGSLDDTKCWKHNTRHTCLGFIREDLSKAE